MWLIRNLILLFLFCQYGGQALTIEELTPILTPILETLKTEMRVEFKSEMEKINKQLKKNIETTEEIKTFVQVQYI